MRGRRRLALAFALVSVAVAGTLAQRHMSVSAKEQPPGELVRVMQWNICGSAQHCANKGGSGSGTSVARLAEEAQARTPDLLGVNEICRTQFQDLERLLALRGWRMQGAYDEMHDNVKACGADSSYGLAVFSRQQLTGPAQYRPFTHAVEEYESMGRVEKVRRGVLCAPTTVRDRPVMMCGSHSGTEPEQLDEAHRWFADEVSFPSDLPVVFAGDLNQQPNEAPLAGLYSHTRGEKDKGEPTGRFIEADEAERSWFRRGAAGGVRCDEPKVQRCRNGAPTAADGRKIDYIFGTDAHFTAPVGRTTNLPESDHVLYEGTFRFQD